MARISRAGSSALCSGPSVREFWRRHSRIRSRPSKPGTARRESWAQRDVGPVSSEAYQRRSFMKRIALLTIAVVTLACFVVPFSTASGHAAGDAVPIYVTQVPSGYRDWKVISMAHEEGNLNSFGAILGNDTAIKARDGKVPYPDGTIIAALHYRHTRRRKTTKFSAA